MDDTLTGVIGTGNSSSPKSDRTASVTAKKRDVKGALTFLGSATALFIALGAVLEQGAGLSQTMSDLMGERPPKTSSEWTEDEAVVIEPNASISSLTIQICDRTLESGESMHIAFLLGNTLLPAFVLKKKGCPGEPGRIQMNPHDFVRYIKHSAKADFKLSYSRAHLHSLDQLVTDALNQCGVEPSVEHATGDKQS